MAKTKKIANIPSGKIVVETRLLKLLYVFGYPIYDKNRRHLYTFNYMKLISEVFYIYLN